MKTTISFILCAILLSCFVHVGYSQNKDNDLPDVDQSIVTFNIQSSINLTDDNSMQVPSDITDMLKKQEPLGSLNIEMRSVKNKAWLQASYVFASMDAYLKWRKADDTKKFIQTLRDNNEKNIRMSIALQRQPLNEYVKYNKQQ